MTDQGTNTTLTPLLRDAKNCIEHIVFEPRKPCKEILPNALDFFESLYRLYASQKKEAEAVERKTINEFDQARLQTNVLLTNAVLLDDGTLLLYTPKDISDNPEHVWFSDGHTWSPEGPIKRYRINDDHSLNQIGEHDYQVVKSNTDHHKRGCGYIFDAFTDEQHRSFGVIAKASDNPYAHPAFWQPAKDFALQLEAGYTTTAEKLSRRNTCLLVIPSKQGIQALLELAPEKLDIGSKQDDILQSSVLDHLYALRVTKKRFETTTGDDHLKAQYLFTLQLRNATQYLLQALEGNVPEGLLDQAKSFILLQNALGYYEDESKRVVKQLSDTLIEVVERTLVFSDERRLSDGSLIRERPIFESRISRYF